MVYNYIFIGLLILVAALFAAGPLLAVAFLAPKKKSVTKTQTYECGVLTGGGRWVKFPM